MIDFSAAYSPFFQAVFGPKTVAVKTPADLNGKSVGVTRGAMEDLELGKRDHCRGEEGGRSGQDGAEVARSAGWRSALTRGA